MAKKKNDILKQSLTLGLGLMDLTKSKLDKMVKEINKGISEKDKKQAVDRLVKRARAARNLTEKTIRSQVKKVVAELEKESGKSSKKKKSSKRKGSKKRRG